MVKRVILAIQDRVISKTLVFIKNRDLEFKWKIDLSLLPYTVFDAEFDSGSKIGPKLTQDPILTNFRKTRFFARRHGGLTQLMTDAHIEK